MSIYMAPNLYISPRRSNILIYNIHNIYQRTHALNLQCLTLQKPKYQSILKHNWAQEGGGGGGGAVHNMRNITQ